MTNDTPTANDAPRDLVLNLELDAPRQLVWRCWTQPDLLIRWFAPAPWQAVRADLDVRPGGSMTVAMRGPDGQEMASPGVFLEVAPGERLVFTDAYAPGWQPNENPFFTAIISLADAGDGRTAYQAQARHWTAENCKKHEEMGFQTGWAAAARQLEEVARELNAS